MDDTEKEQQQRLHNEIEQSLREVGDLDGNSILAGWVICWESATLSEEEDRQAGQFHGPEGMAIWRVLGLVEWVRRFCLRPGDEDGERDE